MQRQGKLPQTITHLGPEAPGVALVLEADDKIVSVARQHLAMTVPHMLPSSEWKRSAPAISIFQARSHTPRNGCIRFAATVASDHATLTTKRTLLLTSTDFHRLDRTSLRLAHSFDDLVGERQKFRRHFEAQ